MISGSLPKGYGHGGAKYVASLSNMAPRTVRAGILELETLDLTRPEDFKRKRIRKEGGGRKPTAVNEPQLLNTITEIIEGRTYGDSESILLWTNLSLLDISEELKKRSIIAGKDVFLELQISWVIADRLIVHYCSRTTTSWKKRNFYFHKRTG